MSHQYTLEEKILAVESIVKDINRFWIKYKSKLFNQTDFWDSTLHSFTNEDWEIMMEVMEVIRMDDPSCYLPGSAGLFDEVRKVLMYEAHSGNPKAMDARKHKKLEFKALMHVKDILNNYGGYEAPTKFDPDPEPPTVFESLFEIQKN